MLLILMLALCVFDATAASGQGDGEPDPMAVELWQQLETLVVSVVEGDTVALDQATCLVDLVQSQLDREEALGLVPNAVDPPLVESRRTAARERASAYILDLLAKGDQVVAIEISRIREFDAADIEEVATAEGEPTLPITAAGNLGVELLDLPRMADLSVYRLGADRWCFDPLSMPIVD